MMIRIIIIIIIIIIIMQWLTLTLLMWRIWWAPNNVSRWQMGFNSAVKRLIIIIMGGSKNLLCSEFPRAGKKIFFQICRQFGQASSVWFASPGPRRSGCALGYRQPQFAVSCPQMDRSGACAVRLPSSASASRAI